MWMFTILCLFPVVADAQSAGDNDSIRIECFLKIHPHRRIPNATEVKVGLGCPEKFSKTVIAHGGKVTFSVHPADLDCNNISLHFRLKSDKPGRQLFSACIGEPLTHKKTILFYRGRMNYIDCI